MIDSTIHDTSNSGVFVLWDVELPADCVPPEGLAYLRGLPARRPTVSWIWAEMDRVWRSLGLDKVDQLPGDVIGAYYAHPIWLVNGVFTESDPESREHRAAIADFVRSLAEGKSNQSLKVADYGGGFGGLSRAIVKSCPSACVDIVEPYPSQVARRLVSRVSGVRFVDRLTADYDVVVAQDVLEHVSHPIDLAIDLAAACRPGGTLIFANSFYPVIACHLPETFYLRHTFDYVMAGLGLRKIGRIDGAPHAVAFERPDRLSEASCRRRQSAAMKLGPWLNFARSTLGHAKRSLLRQPPAAV